jgi:2-keto-4-pentenoate hydratase/2-oxohepta-3-ene-1,7-dioic acid hydratase in catechol pathway
MKLVTFTEKSSAEPAQRLPGLRTGRVGVAVLEEGTVLDLGGVLPGGEGMLDLIERWSELRPVIERELDRLPATPLEQVDLLAPIPVPRRNIFCVGKNYREHVAEFGGSGYDTPERSLDLPDKPILFSKATTSVTWPTADIDPHHGVTAELDYEGELGVIIGAGGRGISRQDATDHVWAYTIINDVTARDLQRDHKQWLLGKSLDTHCPMGPYAVTADEIGDVTALELQTHVNGEPRQSAPIKDMIFDVPELIATISAGITLLPGDVIATGTPAGVGIGFTPPRFLVSGDMVEVTITGLGTLRNRVA